MGLKGVETVSWRARPDPGNPQRTRKLLLLQPVEEIWGVGNRIARELNVLGIKTALDLALTNPAFIRKISPSFSSEQYAN